MTKQERYNKKMKDRVAQKKERAERDRANTPELIKPIKLPNIRAYSGHYTQREYWRNLGMSKRNKA